MIQFISEKQAHLNIVVDSIEKATEFYCNVFGAAKKEEFPHFKNIGFAKSLGFLDEPEKVEVSIRYLILPGTTILIELVHYHSPVGSQDINFAKINDMGGPRHVGLKVKDIDEAFKIIKAQRSIKLASDQVDYKPFYMNKITPEECKFFDPEKENDPEAKQMVCNFSDKIGSFHFTDPYGVMWEFQAIKLG